jgi:hypothetical protein
MGIGMAAVLAVACFAQDERAGGYNRVLDEDARALDGIAGVRLGVWTGRDFSFQAIRTDGLQSTSKQQALFSASAMLGMEFYDHFRVLASVEEDVASKITAEVGGLYLGWRERPKERYGRGVPDEATVYAGVVFGGIKVHEPDFGEFDRGVGFGGGLSFGWILSPRWTFDFIAEYRYLKFDYRRDVTSGDTSIGGHGAWLGLGLGLRF